MERLKLVCLHGFLGLPSDWDFLKPDWAVDILEIRRPSQCESMKDWAREFNRHAEKIPGPKALLGYSMGGRLAMHALVDRPDLWSAAVLVSTNPGMAPEEEREPRAKADELWARRFEMAEWNETFQSWERLPVFGGYPSPIPRQEKDYDRAELAAVLRNWSLAHQENLMERVARLPLPIFWVAGQDDQRYVKLGERFMELSVSLTEEPSAEKPRALWVAPGAAHRVPWEMPEEFKLRVQDFLEKRGSYGKLDQD